MTGSEQAALNATKLSEIGFPEFTAKLIKDTFDAIVAAEMSQTQSYISLVGEVAKSVSDFAKDNQASIGGDEVLSFLRRVAPDKNNPVPGTIVIQNSTLYFTLEQANAINNAVEVESSDIPVIDTDNLNSKTIGDYYNDIIEAVSRKLAADKYAVLKQMVSLGMTRLTIDQGEIESRLTFNTYGSSFFTNNAATYNTNSYNQANSLTTGFSLTPWFSAAATSNYSGVTVTTTNGNSRDTSGSQVQIYGSVKLTFKTVSQT